MKLSAFALSYGLPRRPIEPRSPRAASFVRYGSEAYRADSSGRRNASTEEVVVRHALGKRDAGEAAEGQPGVDRRLQPLVGQPVPLLQEQQLDVGQQRVGRPALTTGVDAGDDPLQGRPVERRVQAVEPLALLAAPPHDAVRQAKLPEVTPRHRRDT